jgi:hypothetical protein
LAFGKKHHAGVRVDMEHYYLSASNARTPNYRFLAQKAAGSEWQPIMGSE